MRICIQSQDLVDNYGFADAYRMIREAGFTGIDWNLDHAWDFKKVEKAPELRGLCVFEKSLPEIMEYYREELDAIRANGLAISQAHAPFGGFSSDRPDILDYAIGIYQKMIEFCDAVGCPRLIVHGISMRENDEGMTFAVYNAVNAKLYESLIPALRAAKNVTVCMENLFFRPKRFSHGSNFWVGHCANPDEAARTIDALNEKAGKKCFGLCMDTGHLNLLRTSFRTYVPVLGDRIAALHIHDNTQEDDSHLMPYSGTIFWSDFTAALREVGYSGDLSFETYRQYIPERLPAALVPGFLRLNCEIGEYFRSEIQK